MLELQNISREVGDEVYVDDVSLCLQRGELNILLGPTLAGKTSLMRIMAGLDKPDSGAETQCCHGLSTIHQLPHTDSL